MKRYVKIISLICTVAMLLCCIPAMSVSAASPSLSVVSSSTSVEAGKTFTLTVSVKNRAGLYSVAFNLSVNEKVFEFVSASTSGSVCDQLGMCGYNASSKEYKFNGMSSDVINGLPRDGMLVKITLKAKSNASAGDYVFSARVDSKNTVNLQGQSVNASGASARVSIKDKVVPAVSAITAADMTLGKDMSLTYYAKLDPTHAGAKMRFTVNGKETVVDGTPTGVSGEYEYVFSGMPPQCMGDTIKAELVLNGSVLAVKDGYSVLQYCKNILSSSASKLGMTEEKYNSMRVLIADLLEYGAKAQVYMNYKTDALVNEGITGASRVDRIEEDGKVVKPTRLEGVELRAFGVHFDSACSLFVKLTAPEMKPGELRINFSDTTYYLLSDCQLIDEATSTYYLKLDELSVLDYGTLFDVDIEIYDESEGAWKLVQTSRYSISSYAYSMQDSQDGAMAELALSLYKYGVSASEFNK